MQMNNDEFIIYAKLYKICIIELHKQDNLLWDSNQKIEKFFCFHSLILSWIFWLLWNDVLSIKGGLKSFEKSKFMPVTVPLSKS